MKLYHNEIALHSPCVLQLNKLYPAVIGFTHNRFIGINRLRFPFPIGFQPGSINVEVRNQGFFYGGCTVF